MEEKNIPKEFVKEVEQLLKQDAQLFLDAMQQPAKTSIRFNPFKVSNHFQYNGSPIPWCNNGLLLDQRPSFIADPLFHAGAYYVQESSSMFLDQMVRSLLPQLPEHPMVLDLCAAPGGKSTLLASVFENKGLIVCNEVIKSRVNVLLENIEKWGCNNLVVTNNDSREWVKMGPCFDLIVTDAPCSGEGMFRREKHAMEEWSEELVKLCAARQERILNDAMKLLKPGGILIYSTCTLNTIENEEQVLQLMSEYGMQTIPVPNVHDSIHSINQYKDHYLNAYRFYFHRIQGEGLFMCCLQKPGEQVETIHYNKRIVEAKGDRDLAEKWLEQNEQYTFITSKNKWYAIPKMYQSKIEEMQKKLNVVSMGIRLGEVIKADLIPDHALALSRIVNESIPRVELDLLNARKYLMRESPDRKLFQQNGWQLVTFAQLPLGWVKVLPNRVNNYFPTHLRVIKNILDETS